MIKKLFVLLMALLTLPSLAMAGQIGGFSRNLGGQMLTVTANIGYESMDVETNGVQDDMSSRSFTVTTTYGLSDRLDLFLNVGFADIQDIGSFTGALGTLLGGGFKYLIMNNTESDVQLNINGNIRSFKSSDSGQTADYLGYHVAAVVSHKAGNFTPFGGIKISDAEVDKGGDEYESDDNFGLFGGVDYFVNPNVYFTGEVHIFDETSIYMGVGYNF